MPRQLIISTHDIASIYTSKSNLDNVSADEIFPGYAEIKDFAEEHPEELIMCFYHHLVMPGNAISGTRPIPDDRKEELSDIILRLVR